MKKKILPKILLGIFLLLLLSVIISSLLYQYDLDELFHIQIVYLLSLGLHPYRDFFLIYTHIFHLFLFPIFSLFGFHFSTIIIARFVMVFLLLIRLLLLFLIVKKLFSFQIACVSVFFHLLNPLGSFYGAQIRPDALAVTLFLSGILLYVCTPDLKNRRYSFFSGLFFGLTLVVNVKLIPSMGVLFISLFLSALMRKKMIPFFYLLTGLILPIISYCAFFWVRGEFFVMIQNVTKDAALMLSSQLFPSHIWFYFKPDNDILFGQLGRPLPWVFSLVEIILVVIGGTVTVLSYKQVKDAVHTHRSFIHISILAMLCAQWAWLFSMRSVFGQYFLTVGWMMSIFSAVGFFKIGKKLENRLHSGLYTIVLVLILFAFSWGSIFANMNRLRFTIWDTQKQFLLTQSQIPEAAVTFPNYLFHPFAYPITYGTFIGDVPKEILNRLGSISEVLDKKNVQFVFVSDYTIQFFDQNTQKYIKSHYKLRSDGVYIKI